MLSGHSRGDTTDSYVQSLPCLTMVPARAIAEWPNPNEMVYPPTLDALGAANVQNVAKFIHGLFYIAPQLTDLRSGGRLTMLIQTALASIIMYHPQMEADHPNGNTIVEKVNAAAASAGISSEEFKKWSDSIKARFEDDNFPNSPRNNEDKQADMEHILRSLSTSNRMSQRANSKIQKLEAELSLSNQIKDSLSRELLHRDERDRIRDANEARRDKMLTNLMAHLRLNTPPAPR